MLLVHDTIALGHHSITEAVLAQTLGNAIIVAAEFDPALTFLGLWCARVTCLRTGAGGDDQPGKGEDTASDHDGVPRPNRLVDTQL